MPVDSVFLDSSVLIAATLSSTGRARDLVIQGMRGEWRLLTSDYVMDETGRNISRKAPQAYPVFNVFRQLLMVALVDPPPSLVQEVATVTHQKDAPIVAAAIHGEAQWLASYDRRHVLSFTDIIRSRYHVVATTPDDILSSRDAA